MLRDEGLALLRRYQAEKKRPKEETDDVSVQVEFLRHLAPKATSDLKTLADENRKLRLRLAELETERELTLSMKPFMKLNHNQEVMTLQDKLKRKDRKLKEVEDELFRLRQGHAIRESEASQRQDAELAALRLELSKREQEVATREQALAQQQGQLRQREGLVMDVADQLRDAEDRLQPWKEAVFEWKFAADEYQRQLAEAQAELASRKE
ncbi:MAG: hypothetical protein KVP17_004321 [Porospora cf. gigantea B]|uniref:uncharacterized protein n=1 Tax=Porospora cf. gigantea B TaxID=2853592 RepID=UPI003571CC9F|nr:MAG: hypothetical protein KVP17_004321 [Porospora cf. gigantea B]